MNATEQLVELIRKLENISSELNSVLKQEQAILKSQDSKQLMTLSKEKKTLVSELEKHTKTTHIFLNNMKINKGLYGLSSFISKLKPSDSKELFSTLWSSIETLSEGNKKLNAINGSIIELNRRHTQRCLDVLRGQVGTSTATYGSNGQTMKSKISRNISIV